MGRPAELPTGTLPSSLRLHNERRKPLMRKFLLTVAATAFLALPVATSAQTFQIGPGGIHIDDGRRGASGQCEELRLACENKDRLGEQGAGNCQRYRETCQQ